MVKNQWLLMTSDNSPSRSLVRSEITGLPATLGPELEEAAGYARAEKARATRQGLPVGFRDISLLVRGQARAGPSRRS
jgi:hypothetical protein